MCPLSCWEKTGIAPTVILLTPMDRSKGNAKTFIRRTTSQQDWPFSDLTVIYQKLALLPKLGRPCGQESVGLAKNKQILLDLSTNFRKSMFN